MTAPAPVPVGGPLIAIQLAALTALHMQAAVVPTVMAPLPPPVGAATAEGVAVYWQEVPSWVTTWTAPFTVRTAVRPLAAALGGTL